jgi:hypothetical protein
MGWDITYHPVGPDEIQSIYFKGLTDHDHYKSLVTQFGVNDFYAEQLRSRFEEARNIKGDVSFQKGHAFYVAIISGFLRKHHYIRGGAFSFLADDDVMARYVGDWKILVPEAYRDRHFDNCLTENYCGGVYLTNEGLKKLRDDYQSDSYVRSKMDETFSHGRLAVFWKAVDEAIESGLGLVEASEVVEPNPFNLNATRSLSNLFNCYPDGALLYEEAAIQQITEVQKSDESKVPEKKGFFARLFRKI